MSAGITVNSQISLDPAELLVQFVRSPGPGGQNVNKVNSKAIVHWNLAASRNLPLDVAGRIREQAGNRINNEGFLVVSSHQSRNQAENLAFCHAKIRQIILQALSPPKTRKATKATRASKQRRLVAKRQVSEKKASRGGQSWGRD
jgi:ribosome-associated protein